MLDEDLAALYEVETRVLNQAVKRNSERFPEDFMFQFTEEEWSNLRSQSVTSSYGGRRYLPRVFTQEGVAMLSSVLRSKRAVEVNVEIMRAFVRYRQLIVAHGELTKKLEAIEREFGGRLDSHDEKFRMLAAAVRMLRDELRGGSASSQSPAPGKSRRRIGFHHDEGESD